MPTHYVQPDDPRVIVFGSRTFTQRKLLFRKMDTLCSLLNHPIICHGNADGADKIGEEWAFARKHNVMRFHAQWRKHGKKAGMIRNVEMAKYAIQRRPAFGIAFWDGKSPGTKHMIDLCRKYKIKLRIIYYKEEKRGISSEAPPKYLELRRRSRERRNRSE